MWQFLRPFLQPKKPPKKTTTKTSTMVFSDLTAVESHAVSSSAAVLWKFGWMSYLLHQQFSSLSAVVCGTSEKLTGRWQIFSVVSLSSSLLFALVPSSEAFSALRLTLCYCQLSTNLTLFHFTFLLLDSSTAQDLSFVWGDALTVRTGTGETSGLQMEYWVVYVLVPKIFWFFIQWWQKHVGLPQI